MTTTNSKTSKVTLIVTSAYGTRKHTFHGPKAQHLADYWAAYWRKAGHEVRPA